MSAQNQKTLALALLYLAWRSARGYLSGARALEVLLNKAGTEVNVELYQRQITNRFEAVDLAGFYDKDVSSATLEGLVVYRPHSPAFTDELDFVIRMPVRTRSRTGFSMEQEHRNIGIALGSSNKLMRTTDKG